MRRFPMLLTLWLALWPAARLWQQPVAAQSTDAPPTSVAAAQKSGTSPPLSASRGQGSRASASTASPRLLLAHYMPWYEANPARKQWGWHWTMNHYHPERVTDSKPELASHYHPLLGLYDSNDTDALECHVLLMKYAGIDGVILDWYGTQDFLDYGNVHRNAQHLVALIKKAGLHFAVCYEDQSAARQVAAHLPAQEAAVALGQQTLAWLQAHWFTDPAYVKQDSIK